MSKLTEIEKLKYWLDAEVSILHVMLAGIAVLLVSSIWVKILLGVYIIYTFIYALVRIAYVGEDDKNYLKIPKE